MKTFRRFLTLSILCVLSLNYAWGVDFSFTSVPTGWPNSSSSTANGSTEYTYTVGGTSYSFLLGQGCYVTTSVKLLHPKGKSTRLPALSGYKLTKVVGVLNDSGSPSTKSEVSITTNGSTVVSGGTKQTWNTKGGSYTYNLTGTAENTRYYLTVSSTANCQIKSLSLTYTATSTPSHTLSSAVSPTGAGSVALGASSVVEGGTTTATATANTGYTFSSWSISGTGASLSSTSANPTTVTMGTANATVTANFTAKTAASITLSELGATSTVAGSHYAGDSYTLPTTTSAACPGKVLVGWSTVTIPTPGAKPSSNYYDKGTSVTLSAGLNTFYAVFATNSGGGSDSETLTGTEISTHFTSSAVSYGDAEKSWTDGDITWAARFSAVATGPYFQLKNDANVYIKIIASGDITSVSMSATGTTCSGSGCNLDIDEHNNATAIISLQTEASGGTTVASGTATNKSITLTPTGNNSTLYIKVDGATKIWGDITVNYSSATYSLYTTSCAAVTDFENGTTIFIQAHTTSAFSDGKCVKAWFHKTSSDGAAQTTYWLFDADPYSSDAGKKLFATIVPATGELPYLDVQRFNNNCNSYLNKNGGCSYADANGSNAVRSTGKTDTQNANDNYIFWNSSGVTMELHGDPSGDNWVSSLASVTDQGAGIWSGTYNNYTPDATSAAFKIKTNYNGWIGNYVDATHQNSDAELSGMLVGSTYNVTATLNITDHSLVMTKTFVKGTVHFDKNDHGGAGTIDDLMNVAAGATISAPSEPEDDDYLFGGWYTDEGCTAGNEWNFATDVMAETMTLYAKWSVKPKYTVLFHTTNGDPATSLTETSYGGGVTPPEMPASCGDWNFIGWSTTESTSPTNETPLATVTLTAGKYHPTADNTHLYPVYTSGGTLIEDGFGVDETGVTGTSYTDFSDLSVTSEAVYAGTVAKGNNAIQLNTGGNNDRGIVTTTSGGIVTKIAFSWNTNTQSGRTIDIYGKNTAYTGSAELYNVSTQGTKLGSIVYGTSTELVIAGSYEYIGLRSSTGNASYLDAITVTWSTGTMYYYSYPACIICTTPTLSFDHASETHTIGDVFSSNTLTVTGNSLNAPLTYGTSSIGKATVNPTTGELTLKQATKSDEPVLITAMLAAASNEVDACTNSVSESYSLYIKAKVRWFNNGDEITTGSQTTATFSDQALTFPTNPTSSECGSKQFVGWTTIENWDSDEAPSPLYLSSSTVKVNTNTNFYAVYATAGAGDPVSTLAESLQYDTWTKGGSSTDKDTYRLFHNGGYVESENNIDFSKLDKVIVYGGTFGGDSYNTISIREGASTIWKNGTVSGKKETAANEFTDGASLTGSAKLRVYSTCGSNSGSGTGVRISAVDIYTLQASTVYTGYKTNCCESYEDPVVTYETTTLNTGGSQSAKPTITGDTYGTVSYSSSDPSILSVVESGTNAGKVTPSASNPGYVTITAHWTKAAGYCPKDVHIEFVVNGELTITFNANGGTGSMASQTIPFNVATALHTMSGLSYSGKIFVGWNTAPDGSGKKYADGATAKFTAHTTLYAQWATAYTITLNRNGTTEPVYVLSTDFPYTLPTAESDYCDAWTFAGWSATAVANNSDEYTPITEVVTPGNTTVYAVYKGDPTNANAYVRITSESELTSGSDYIFVAHSNGKKYVMTNSYNTTYNDYGEITTTQINESGKDYFLTDPIPATSVYVIAGSTNSWTIKNKNESNYYINLANADNKTYPWYTTYLTNNTYKMSPNGMYWTIESNASVTRKYFDAVHKNKSKSAPARVVFTVYDRHSGCLQIYKKGTAPRYKYTSTPSGTGCTQPCTSCGAAYTYPSLTKTISSQDFINTVIYSGPRNTSDPAYTSSNTDVATVNATSGWVHIEGIGETTITMTQGRDATDPVHPICGATLSYTLTVTSPVLDVVEVQSTDTYDKIIVEHDFGGVTTASTGMESSITKINGTIADDIFISKYYEAANDMKLFALYNGTTHDIDLSELRVQSGSSTWGDRGCVTLKDVEKIGQDFPGYKLPAFTEIIFWSNNESGDANGQNAQLQYCVDMTINDKKYTYDDMVNDKVPNWYRVVTVSGKSTAFNFNGDDGLILERSEDNGVNWTIIDLLGAGSDSGPITPTGSGNGVVHVETSTTTTSSDLNDTPGGYYWDNTSAAGKVLSTNRFYLTRLSNVRSGEDAVAGNTATFATLGTEWTGEGIGGGKTMDDYCNSGTLFSTVAQYDYAKYYTDYVTYTESWDAADNNDGTMSITFGPGKLKELACKKLRITVRDSEDNTKSAQIEYSVPIIVKDGEVTTMDEIFSEHEKEDCKVCDVAILNGGVLTKANPATPAQITNDREEVYNVDVYAGGELYIPAGTEYTVNTLTVRSVGDGVGLVDVQGTLNCNNSTLIHYKRLHNVGSDYRWYYFTLPYDCNVNEVTFSNGEPALHGVDFEIDWYDGEQRAQFQADGNWKSVAVHPEFPNIIKAGYGYTIAIEKQAGHDNTTLLFPMANFEEVNDQLAVPVGNWGAGDDAVPVNHKGWNVVGNPFLTKYKAQEDIDINGELRAGLLEYSVTEKGWIQTTNPTVNYVTIAYDGGKSGYDQWPLTNHQFNPFHSYIIQAGGDTEKDNLRVLFKNAYKRHHGASMIRRTDSEIEAGELEPVWLQVDLSNASGEKDVTTLILSDRYTPDYDMTYDLAKWRGSSYKRYTKPVLASTLNGYELVFNAIPDSVAKNRVPLTYYTRTQGTMEFQLSGAYNWGVLEEVMLHDDLLGVDHNLLTDGAYTFTANAGETSNRFSISAKVNRYKAPNVATGMDLVELQNVQIFTRDHTLLLNGLEKGTQVYVFDMSGRLVGRQLATLPYMQFNIPVSGVYNIRLVGQKAGITLRALVQ